MIKQQQFPSIAVEWHIFAWVKGGTWMDKRAILNGLYVLRQQKTEYMEHELKNGNPFMFCLLNKTEHEIAILNQDIQRLERDL